MTIPLHTNNILEVNYVNLSLYEKKNNNNRNDVIGRSSQNLIKPR